MPTAYPINTNIVFLDSSQGWTVVFPSAPNNTDRITIVNEAADDYTPIILDGNGNNIRFPGNVVVASGEFVLHEGSIEFVWNEGKAFWYPLNPFVNPMTFHGNWIGGRLYPYRAVARDEGWAMVSNKQTYEKPAPSPIGEPYWLHDEVGPATWEDVQVIAASLVVGQRYISQKDAYFRGARFWLSPSTVGQTVEMWFVDNPTTVPAYTNILPQFVVGAGDVGDWVIIPQGAVLAPIGTEFDVVLIISPFTGELSFTYQWLYQRSNALPVSGEMNQPNNAPQLLRVHQEDSTATNRSAELDLIVAGSTITTGGVTWNVLNATKVVDFYEFEVTPAIGGTVGLQDVTFRYFGTSPINYVREIDFYSASPGVQGFKSETGYDPDGMTLNDNAYGVDVQAQDALLPSDWDLLSAPPA